MRIAIVGGGIFGSTVAWYLSGRGMEVSLFEQATEVLTHASAINQYRLHRGYHYPRSDSTARSSKDSQRLFELYYDDAIVRNGTQHYYCIANGPTQTSPDGFIRFLESMRLEYERVEPFPGSDLTVRVVEDLFDPDLLRASVVRRLQQSSVDLHLGTCVESVEDLKGDFDVIVVATYAGINGLLPDECHQSYQYELIEKPVLKLPEWFRGKSIVYMDGPFFCVDPFGTTQNHVMGHVVHSIHGAATGAGYVPPQQYRQLINRGAVDPPSFSQVPAFIEDASRLHPLMADAEHLASMFTIRTVLPFRDHDDARPSLVEEVQPGVFTLFSGKIGTCVDVARRLFHAIDRR